MSKLSRVFVALSILLVAVVFVSARSHPPAAVSPPEQTAAAPGAQPASRGDSSLPRFLEVNKRYSFRWEPGDNEVYRVLEIREGWIRGRRDPGNAAQEGAKPLEVWLNPARAITVTEVQ